MCPKEKIEDFKQRYLKLLNKIPDASKPRVDVQIEFYIVVFPTFTTMFVKHTTKVTLEETMLEAINIDKEIIYIANGSPTEENKNPQPTKKVTFKEEKKDKGVFYMESLQKIIKIRENEVVHIKKKVLE